MFLTQKLAHHERCRACVEYPVAQALHPQGYNPPGNPPGRSCEWPRGLGSCWPVHHAPGLPPTFVDRGCRWGLSWLDQPCESSRWSSLPGVSGGEWTAAVGAGDTRVGAINTGDTGVACCSMKAGCSGSAGKEDAGGCAAPDLWCPRTYTSIPNEGVLLQNQCLYGSWPGWDRGSATQKDPWGG